MHHNVSNNYGNDLQTCSDVRHQQNMPETPGSFADMKELIERKMRSVEEFIEIIYLGKPDGPTCHTGMETCYYTSLNALLPDSKVEQNKLAMTTLYSLESTITQRKLEVAETENEKPSWTKRLLLDNSLLCSKIREEADELCRTLEENEDKSGAASEMADVLYHALVLLAVKDVKVEDVFQVLRQRFSKSGIEEKSSRKST
ncbi:hypothetical protein Scep_013671 [Stephania cephalantha]|uniref:phosphoribosyl-ATP diphosphatase n=1 Tax=Stephania cephalantha TaxID=152367 RepID=A0AAP0P0Y7_9MAGN